MSNLVMARIKPLNGPLLIAAEQHGRRLDKAAQNRKVRDEPSLTWVPEGVEGDPLALSERLADHIAGAMVPKAKAKALHMLVKLPASVPVETEADARAALALVVQFAQETYGGRAVFSARMDRDERSLNSVDLFLAPRYLKVTKRKSEEAISLTRFGKLLAQKHGIEDRSDSAKGSMQAQGSALQDELAAWLTSRGFEAQRGVAKERGGDDWKTPEVMGARKDRAAIEALIAEQLPEAMDKRIEAERLLADAARIKDDAEAAAEQAKRAAAAAALEIRMQAEAEAARIRNTAKTEADRLAAKAVQDREQHLAAEERILLEAQNQVEAQRKQINRDRDGLNLRMELVRRSEEQLVARKAKVAAQAAEVGNQASFLAGLIERLEPMLKIVARIHDRLQAAPENVRRWLDGSDRIGDVIKTANPLLDQARQAVRDHAQRKNTPDSRPVDLDTQAAFLADKRKRGM